MEYYYTRLILMRHGQARSGKGEYGPDNRLSPLGVKQSESLAKAVLAAGGPEAIYSSPYPRAQETALKLSERQGREVIVDQRLSEIYVEAMPYANLEKHAYLLIWKPEHRGSKDGETVEAFFARVDEFCEEVCHKHKNKTIAVVAHAGTIVGIYRWAIGIPNNWPWTFIVEIGNASISEIEMWPQGRIENGPPRHAVLRRIGDCSHLKGIESNI